VSPVALAVEGHQETDHYFQVFGPPLKKLDPQSRNNKWICSDFRSVLAPVWTRSTLKIYFEAMNHENYNVNMNIISDSWYSPLLH